MFVLMQPYMFLKDDTCVVVLYPPEPGAESFNASLVDSSLALTYMKVSDPGRSR